MSYISGSTSCMLPGRSVPKVDLSGAVKKKRAASGFGFQVILEGYLCVSGTRTLDLSCLIIYNLS